MALIVSIPSEKWTLPPPSAGRVDGESGARDLRLREPGNGRRSSRRGAALPGRRAGRSGADPGRAAAGSSDVTDGVIRLCQRDNAAIRSAGPETRSAVRPGAAAGAADD